jgi:hypothetical protein
MRMNVCVALGAEPLLAVMPMVNGEPAVLDGVPERRPVVGSRLAHDGSPVAENVGLGFPVAVMVNDPGERTVNVAVLALVMTDGWVTAFTKSSAGEEVSELIPFVMRHRNWSPDIFDVATVIVSVGEVVPE